MTQDNDPVVSVVCTLIGAIVILLLVGVVHSHEDEEINNCINKYVSQGIKPTEEMYSICEWDAQTKKGN